MGIPIHDIHHGGAPFPVQGDLQVFFVVKVRPALIAVKGLFILRLQLPDQHRHGITDAALYGGHTPERKPPAPEHSFSNNLCGGAAPCHLGKVKVGAIGDIKYFFLDFLIVICLHCCYLRYLCFLHCCFLRLPDCVCRCGSGHSRGSRNARRRCRPGAYRDAPGSF